MTEILLNSKAGGMPVLRFDRATVFVICVCLLCPLTNLKFGDVQSVEVFGVLYIFYACSAFAMRGFKVRAPPEIISLIEANVLFLFVITALALFALRLDTFPPFHLGVLKTPPILSFSRIIQLAICMVGCLLLTLSIVKVPRLLSVACRYYVMGGLISAIYALVSAAALSAGFELSGAYAIQSIRVRGFFIEGGPFGVYLLSVLTVILFRRYQLREIGRLSTIVQATIIFVSFVLAQSKAATLLLILMGTTYLFLTGQYLKLTLVSALASPFVFLFVTQGGLAGYFYNYMNFSAAAAQRPEDSSLVLGRLMASVLAPRMIIEHPITGIGIGNYSVQRNNPALLDGLPETDEWDLPGLGFVGYAAELGVPATLLLMWLLWRPVAIASRANAGPRVAAFGSLQFFVHVMGAQITFIYPWIVSAIVIGYSLTFDRQRPAKLEAGALVLRDDVSSKP